MYKQKRKLLSQNFIYNQKLIKHLISRSSINSNDIVLEIGPGKGFITSQLLKISKKVIAVELDSKLVLHLQKFFPNKPKLELHSKDFLEFNLPKTPYKVFSNIPFSIEGKIVRKLLDSKNPPIDSYLIVRKDLAKRLSGLHKNSSFSTIHKPFFDFEIIYNFKSTDFIPPTNIKCVLWKIHKKGQPLLSLNTFSKWSKFIKRGYGNGQNVNTNLTSLFTTTQIENIEKRLNFSLKIKPSYISLESWIKIYTSLKKCTMNLISNM